MALTYIYMCICTTAVAKLCYNISGVKLSDASKKLGKKFATGASVVKVLFFGIVTFLLTVW